MIKIVIAGVHDLCTVRSLVSKCYICGHDQEKYVRGMSEINWAREICVAITVSDTTGKIVYLNDKSAVTFSKYGGRDLEGKNLKDCHLATSWDKITEIMRSGKSNCYTIEKEGIRKMIFQAPWYNQGQLGGLVELSMEIPFDMEHFVRD